MASIDFTVTKKSFFEALSSLSKITPMARKREVTLEITLVKIIWSL